jgi:nitroimidazol reductase NimA-like FMN-containing flavoprotein (pyridoxamine 5'-phosphate oxidase superfamily)
MFRKMRRAKQQLPDEKAVEILERNQHGVLSLLGDEGFPYGVPISYVYHDGALFFHSAKSGHKVDAVRNYEKATFCVVDQSQVVPEKLTNYFRSAIAFGTIKIVEDLEEMRRITSVLAMKYAPDHKAEIPARVDASIKNLTIFKLTIEHLTAKEAMELINMRK